MEKNIKVEDDVHKALVIKKIEGNFKSINELLKDMLKI